VCRATPLWQAVSNAVGRIVAMWVGGIRWVRGTNDVRRSVERLLHSPAFYAFSPACERRTMGLLIPIESR
jgi:hypothetical protein